MTQLDAYGYGGFIVLKKENNEPFKEALALWQGRGPGEIYDDPDSKEHAGVSVFYKDATGSVFHTYSAYARGIDMLNLAYHYLDLAPKGRDEGGRGQFWVRRHDEYGR